MAYDEDGKEMTEENEGESIDKKEGISIIEESEGFVLHGIKRISDTEISLSELIYDVTVEELGTVINSIVKNNPQVIQYTVFAPPSLKEGGENPPLLSRMN